MNSYKKIEHKEGYPILYEGSKVIGRTIGETIIYDKDTLDSIIPLRIWLGFNDKQEEYVSTLDIFYERFVIERYGTSPRSNEQDYLNSIGYTKKPVNKMEVIIMTNAKDPCDDFWIDFSDGEIYDKEWT